MLHDEREARLVDGHFEEAGDAPNLAGKVALQPREMEHEHIEQVSHLPPAPLDVFGGGREHERIDGKMRLQEAAVGKIFAPTGAKCGMTDYIILRAFTAAASVPSSR
jgi:hypothetical protein